MARLSFRPSSLMLLAAALVSLVVATSTAPISSGTQGKFAQSVDIGGGRLVYIECHGASRLGSPTIILISGYRDSGDVWTNGALSVANEVIPPAVGPSVLATLARGHRVCLYDRPGTVRYTVAGNPLTNRSTPVPEPRTAADIVTELHTLLDVAHVPGPYVLTAHSLGGLFARLYAQTYPDQVRGIVFVDAFSATLPTVFGAKLWPLEVEFIQTVPPGTALSSPQAEKVKLDASIAQVLSASALKPNLLALAVLTKTAPFQTGAAPPAGLTLDEVNRLYEAAEAALVNLAPNTPHTFATGSDHYIQLREPDLVAATTDLVTRRAMRLH